MKVLLLTGALAALVVVSAVAQGPAAPAPQLTVSAGALSELTAEVRLLRAAVEKASQAQTQLQGLSVYLSAQQNRLVQVSGRLDALRRELDAAVTESAAVTARAAQLETALAGSLSAQDRQAMEEMRKSFASEASRAADAELRLRIRESELNGELQTELARWMEMINRLEQATRP